MKHLLVLSVSIFASSGLAQVWEAQCKNLKFVYDTENQKAFVYFHADSGVDFPIARGEIRKKTPVSLGALFEPFSPNEDSEDGLRFSEIRLNKDRGIVYVVQKTSDPKKPRDAIFCETPIRVRP